MDEGANLALIQQGFPRSAMISQSLYPINLDIEAVRKAVAEYEQIARVKVNFDKNEDTLPGYFRWSYGPVRILGERWATVGAEFFWGTICLEQLSANGHQFGCSCVT